MYGGLPACLFADLAASPPPRLTPTAAALAPAPPQVQQGYLDALPLYTELLLGWRASQKVGASRLAGRPCSPLPLLPLPTPALSLPPQGLFLGLLSLAMVPANLAVGAVSAHVSDRALAVGSLALAGAAAAVLAAAGASSLVAFFGGGAALFLATVRCALQLQLEMAPASLPGAAAPPA